MRVDVKPRLILWACERAGRSVDSLAQQQSFRKSPAWVRGEASPTLRQLEHFSKATHTPFGYFFYLNRRKSLCQFLIFVLSATNISGVQPRQEWYQEFARSMGDSPLPFVGSVTLQSDIIAVARRIRKGVY